MLKIAVLLAACLAIGLGVKRGLPPSASRPAASAPLGFAWPPVPGEPYPDLTLLDDEGRSVSLSQFKGKVILLEPTAMTCPACQAFSGGNLQGIGGFSGVAPQADLVDIG